METQLAPQLTPRRDYPHSISAANTYRQCPRLYYNRYVQGWKDAFGPGHLTFGNHIDQLLAILDLNNLQTALEAIPARFPDPFDKRDVEILLTLWDREYANDRLPPIDLLGKPGNQYPFYINFQGNQATGLMSMTISGKLDKVALIDGEIGVVERKTTSQPIDTKSVYWKRLKMDPQITCYPWGLTKELGKEVGWVVYEVLRRPSAAAHPMFAKAPIKGGKAGTPYSLEEYMARTETILTEPLKKPMVARRKIFITEERKTLWVTEHAQSFLAIQANKERQSALEEQGLNTELAWPRNHLGCEMYGGCPFWDPCVGDTTIEASGKFVRRARNAFKN